MTTGSLIFGRLASMAIQKGLGFIKEKIVPFESTKAYKLAEKEAKDKLALYEKQRQDQIIDNEKKMSFEEAKLFFTRESNLINTKYSAYLNLRSTLQLKDIENFPLDINPLTILQNNGIDTNLLLRDNPVIDDKSLRRVIDGNNQHSKPINVFIMPFFYGKTIVDSEKNIDVKRMVEEKMLTSTERFIVDEYGLGSKRQIKFYSTAWKHGVSNGLHKVEEVFKYMKYLPTIIFEPRYDGQKLEIYIYCWGLGYSDNNIIEEVITFGYDWKQQIAEEVYVNSKDLLSSYEEINDSKVEIQKKYAKKNVELYEKMMKKQNRNNDGLVDFLSLFSVTDRDVRPFAEMISSTISIITASFADIHYLILLNIKPHLPFVLNKHFPELLKSSLATELVSELLNLYSSAYYDICKAFPSSASLFMAEKLQVSKILNHTNLTMNSNNKPIKNPYLPELTNVLKRKFQEMDLPKNKYESLNDIDCLKYYINNLPLNSHDDEKFYRAIVDSVSDESIKFELQKAHYKKSFNY